MERFIGSALIIIASMLTHQYAIDNPILSSTEANEILAGFMALTGFGIAIFLILME